MLDDRTQPYQAGVGPLFHRRFTMRIVGSRMSPAALTEALSADLNRAAPTEFAVFRKLRGARGTLEPSDEYVVRMPGPWNGPVRVVDRDSTSFRLVTLHGHLEAGQIEFRVDTDDGALRFEIESWNRAGDRLSLLLYNRLHLAKEVQLNMWTHFCLRAATIAGGRPSGGITIRTRKVSDLPPPDRGTKAPVAG